ncbi:hypothetical protein [Olivibacter sitiensis]|uniref:hypothetical protein n=1 Tax=Olivibacter sitiensis TaxID=376470 RepID=UPI000426726C|nr:hypothetical protein [Olivibacter sitiensis]
MIHKNQTMTKITISILIAILISTFSFGQNCNCESNFKWVKQTFEENDAGFQYVIDQKGRDAYETHNTAILIRVQAAKTLQECTRILYDWLRFFRKGHFGIALKQQSTPQPIAAEINLASNQKSLKVDDKAFEDYVSSLKGMTPEGVWVSGPYTIGIIKTENDYTGFIVDAPGTQWKKHQIKLKLYPDSNTHTYTGEMWMRNFSKIEGQNVELIGKNHIRIGNTFLLKRENPVYEDAQKVKDYLEFINSTQPYFKKISDKTSYLRIPNFNISQKKQSTV